MKNIYVVFEKKQIDLLGLLVWPFFKGFASFTSKDLCHLELISIRLSSAIFEMCKGLNLQADNRVLGWDK